jgi:signal transduction histidine kinase
MRQGKFAAIFHRIAHTKRRRTYLWVLFPDETVTNRTPTTTPDSCIFDYMIMEEMIPGFAVGIVTERTRIARDLHDTLLQSLAGLAFQIGGLSKIATSELSKRQLQKLRAQADECLREARRAVCNLRDEEPESLDLAAELKVSGERLSAKTVPRFDLSVEGEHRPIPFVLAEQLLRIGMEAIANAARHSCAEQIHVRLRYGADSIGLQVCDNGNGFNLDRASAKSSHFGLRTMRERAERIRASIIIASELTLGTSVHVTVPNSQVETS